MISTGLCAQLACIWEATARKPGNVHRYRDFTDLTYADLIISAAAVAPVLETAPGRRVGETVLEGVRATRRLVQTNTNLGILLLLAPLAAVPREMDPRRGLPVLLDQLNLADARAVYQAIRLAVPGGLGQVPEQDVAAEPTESLREVMALAADRDLVARQYVNAFHEVLEEGVPALERGLEQTRAVEGAIIYCHLHLMAAFPDSLIARKLGTAEAVEASRRAQRTLASGWPKDLTRWEALADLDVWLRAEGNKRNPGTTADLVTASLFVALREQMLEMPSPFSFLLGPRCPHFD
jgi:triphosphoribosyl-dephospho-CoA synthase